MENVWNTIMNTKIYGNGKAIGEADGVLAPS